MSKDQFLVLPSETDYLDYRTEVIEDAQNKKHIKMHLEKGRAGDVSDGYHTFDELYEHRMALTAALCRAYGPANCYRSKNHASDGEPMFEGFFVVGIELPTGSITYHYKLEHWDWFRNVPEWGTPPAWDGHTPCDVVERLKSFAEDAQ